MDKITEMTVFAQVAQDGSFSAAARRLGLSASATSRHVSRLEDRLGVRLLNRTTRHVSLTEAGGAYLARCRRILADVEEAEREVAAEQTVPRGTLRLELPASFGRLHVMPAVPRFLARHPEVRMDITLNERYVDIVEEGIDVAVRVGGLKDSSLIARRLAPNRRMVCGAPAYFARHGVPRVPQDLAGHDCLVYTYRAMRNDWPFVGPDGRQHVVHVTGSIEANSAEALHVAVAAGRGIGLFPLWLVGGDLASGRLVEVLSDYQTADSAIYAVYPPGRHLSAKVRAFVDFLAAHFAGEPLWWRDDQAGEDRGPAGPGRDGLSAGSGAPRS